MHIFANKHLFLPNKSEIILKGLNREESGLPSRKAILCLKKKNYFNRAVFSDKEPFPTLAQNVGREPSATYQPSDIRGGLCASAAQ